MRERANGRCARAFAIVGHSTGCQDAVTLLRTAPLQVRAKMRAAVLQAPVSDRESASLEEDEEGREELLKTAEALVAKGRGDEFLTMHYGFVPMSAQRHALALA